MNNNLSNNMMTIGFMRVLLVDNDKHIVDYVQRGLKTKGYAIEVANRGLDAIALVTEGKFQAIILDLSLPDIHGLRVCERLRKTGVNTPILILTEINTVQDKVVVLRSGADDYMTKPFAFEELLARIEGLIRRRAVENNAEARIFRIADLILNGETHEVMRGESPIDLTQKEFTLLECFMRKPGKVLSRPRILEQVWGYSADPLTNVVDVYVRHLRRKIDDNFDLKLLKTVRGFGYKLDAF